MDFLPIVIGLSVIVAIVGVMFLIGWVLQKAGKLKPIVEDIIKVLPAITDSCKALVVKGPIDTPVEISFTIFSALAKVASNYVEVLSKKATMTSAEKLIEAKKQFMFVAESMGLKLTVDQLKVIEIFIEDAVNVMNKDKLKPAEFISLTGCSTITADAITTLKVEA